MNRFALLAGGLVLAAAPALAQDTLVDWANVNGTDATGTTPQNVTVAPRGSLIVYQDRAAFDAAFPTAGQTCEDFETNLGGDGLILGFPAPLDASTDNAVFAAGSIIPDLSFEDDPLNDANGGSVDGLVFAGATIFGTPSDVVLANTFVDSLNMNILTPRTAVAADVLSFTAGGTATISVFDISDNLLGTVNVAAGPAVPGFVGVSSPVAIGRVNVSSVEGGGADEAEGFDNICLAGAVETAAVPTLSRGGLLLMLMALAALGFVGLRARSH